MQSPHIPRRTRRSGRSPLGVRAVVALTVAAALGGYALALGFTGIPVLVAAAGGLVGGLVLASALAD